MRRIILYGPPVAGKTTMLKAFANARGLQMYQFDPLEGAPKEWIAAGLRLGQGADVVDRGQRVYDGSTGVGLATIWGPFWNTNSWPTLLARADAIVLVLDPQVTREEADADCVQALRTLKQPLRGCIVWTKGDLVADSAPRVSASLLDHSVAANWHVFRARHDEPASLVRPIEWLLGELPSKPSD